MKKLLLLINSLLICVVLYSCGSKPTKSNETKTDSLQTAVAADTLANRKVVIKQDSVEMKKAAASHSAKQTTTVNGTNGTKPSETKSTTPARIEHGSDNQSRLDSIKREKNKLKKQF